MLLYPKVRVIKFQAYRLHDLCVYVCVHACMRVCTCASVKHTIFTPEMVKLKAITQYLHFKDKSSLLVCVCVCARVRARLCVYMLVCVRAFFFTTSAEACTCLFNMYVFGIKFHLPVATFGHSNSAILPPSISRALFPCSVCMALSSFKCLLVVEHVHLFFTLGWKKCNVKC